MQYILADPLLKHLPVEEVNTALSNVGFTDELRARLVVNLSGGEGLS